MNRSRIALAGVLLAGAALLLVSAWWGWTSQSSPSHAEKSDALPTRSKRSPPPDPLTSTEPGESATEGRHGRPPTEPLEDDGSGAPREALGGASELTDEELAELAQELREDPRTHVVCDLDLDVRHSRGYLAIGGHSDRNGRLVHVINGEAYLPLVYDLGELGGPPIDQRSGVFGLEGYGPVPLAWSDPPEGDGLGQCTHAISPQPGRASLTGTLTLRESGLPAAGAWIEGCGNLAFADQHGVVHMDIVPEPCVVIAMRQDGLLRTLSDPVAIEPVPGQDVVVDISIPEAPRGGLGVQLSMSPAGQITIDQILQTGPAGAAGLEAGDVVLAVDGQSTEGMSLGEFVQRVGGEAGTSVELTVVRGEQTMEFDLVREALSPG